MNILLIVNKSDVKTYNAVFKTASNTTVLGAVTCINSNFISVLRDKYNPHVVVIDTDVRCKNTSVTQLLNDILRYSYMKTIVITDTNDVYDYPATKVIRGKITNIALKDALGQLGSSDNYECDKEEKTLVDNLSTRPKTPKSIKIRAKKKFNPIIIIAILSATVLIGVVIAAAIVKSSELSTDYSHEIVETASSADENEDVAVTTAAPSTVAKIKDKTQPAVNSDDKSKSKTQESDSEKSSSNKTDSDSNGTSDNGKSSANTNKSNNADTVTNDNNQNNDSYDDNDDTYYEEHGSAVISYGSDDYRNSQSNEVSSVKLSYNTKTLRIGDTLTISAYVSPSSAPQSVSWSSSDSNVVSVTGNGNLTAHRNGVADITATAQNGKSATCRVTVSGSSYDNSVRLSVTSYNLSVGESLTVKLYNSSNCQWTYSESVVKKLSTGNNSITICGRKRGNTDLTAINKNTGIKYICKINVI